jgi:Protein of unknown function (DUF2975)
MESSMPKPLDVADVLTPSASRLQNPANPLARLSTWMCGAVVVGGLFAEVALAWMWLKPAWVQTIVAPHLGLSGVPVAVDLSTRLAGLAISMIPMTVLFYMLYQAYALFDAFRVGDVFNAETPVRLRRIGLCMMSLALLRPLTAMLLGLALTWANPPGQRILAVTFSIEDFMVAIFGGLVLAIGHVMVEATRLAEDNRQFV